MIDNHTRSIVQPDWFHLLHRLNLNHLLAFLVVAEESSFRAAATRMCISQSAVSVQVRRLEQALGVTLFHRTTRSVVLTAEGRYLFDVARKVSTESYQAAMALRDAAALERGLVRVAALPSLSARLLPHCMRDYISKYPGIDVRLQDLDSQRALEAVHAGDADLAVVSRTDDTQKLQFTPLFREEVFVVVPAAGHPFSKRSQISVHELAGEPLVLNPIGVQMRDIVEETFRTAGLTPNASQVVIRPQSTLALVEEGFGLTLLPHLVLNVLDLSRVRILRIREHIEREIGAVVLKNRAESPAALSFRQYLSSHLGEIRHTYQFPSKTG